jgi:hypothetical protein
MKGKDKVERLHFYVLKKPGTCPGFLFNANPKITFVLVLFAHVVLLTQLFGIGLHDPACQFR